MWPFPRGELLYGNPICSEFPVSGRALLSDRNSRALAFLVRLRSGCIRDVELRLEPQLLSSQHIFQEFFLLIKHLFWGGTFKKDTSGGACEELWA